MKNALRYVIINILIIIIAYACILYINTNFECDVSEIMSTNLNKSNYTDNSKDIYDSYVNNFIYDVMHNESKENYEHLNENFRKTSYDNVEEFNTKMQNYFRVYNNSYYGKYSYSIDDVNAKNDCNEINVTLKVYYTSQDRLHSLTYKTMAMKITEYAEYNYDIIITKYEVE